MLILYCLELNINNMIELNSTFSLDNHSLLNEWEIDIEWLDWIDALINSDFSKDVYKIVKMRLPDIKVAITYHQTIISSINASENKGREKNIMFIENGVDTYLMNSSAEARGESIKILEGLERILEKYAPLDINEVSDFVKSKIPKG